nr:hypothetical protein [Mycobacterium uberis]
MPILLLLGVLAGEFAVPSAGDGNLPGMIVGEIDHEVTTVSGNIGYTILSLVNAV